MISTSKRRFSEEQADIADGVELTLKRKRPRILPIRIAPSYSHHSAPADSPIISQPVPPTLTPGESEEDEHHESPRNCCRPPNIPYILTESLHDDSPVEDMDMLDSPPVHSPAGARLDSPYTLPNRIPTPRYGSFFLHSPGEHGGSDVAMYDSARMKTRSSGLASRTTLLGNRVLPSPINEGVGWAKHMLSPIRSAGEMMGRLAVGSEEQDVAMELGDPPECSTLDTPRQTKGKDYKGARTGKPMLVMGYRMDCEKCKARVPGHYSHLIRG